MTCTTGLVASIHSYSHKGFRPALFRIVVPQNLSIVVSKLCQIRQSSDCKALKLSKGRSGCLRVWNPLWI